MKYSLIIFLCALGLYCKGSNIDVINGSCNNEIYCISLDTSSSAKTFRPIKNCLDTTSLDSFWRFFQSNLTNGNRSEIIKRLHFPIYAQQIVMFHFSYDCDTSKFVRLDTTYADLVIDSTNINTYFDFIFCPMLIKIISETSTQNILGSKNTIIHSKGVTTRFFAKDYDVNIQCPNDHEITLDFILNNGEWLIGIRGL